MNIADLRVDYKKKELDYKHLLNDPLQQFEKWFQEALNAEVPETNAMVLSTVDKEGQPFSRVVLLKGIENRKFLFYTNYRGRKGQQIAVNNKVSVTFFWQPLERQVNIIGTAEKVDSPISDQYFHSRPRKSQLGAWASAQSEPLESRNQLKKKFVRQALRYLGREVPRPPHWGGYAITPSQIEFWQGRPSRLHDRMQFSQQDNGEWKIERLSP